MQFNPILISSRPFELYHEADFNFNNKILAKRMMTTAEKAGVLAPEQYGSRNKKNAIECALNKRLMFD